MALSKQTITQMRLLSLDAIDRAGSGHPGVALGLAPAMYSLWANTLIFDPNHPDWFGRDRFILSCGHASVLLYIALHLAKVKQLKSDSLAISIEDLKKLRRLHSKTAGHPEFELIEGIETSTGPLGQGCGVSVGQALSLKWLDRQFEASSYNLFSGQVFTFLGEGDIMEGMTSEAISLAGHLHLDNLTWLLDRNQISIEGSTDLTFSENIPERFKSCGWRVFEVDGSNVEQITQALDKSRNRNDKKNTKPTLIIANTVIGQGAPTLEGSHKVHAGALSKSDLLEAHQKLSADKKHVPFAVDVSLQEALYENLNKRGLERRKEWENSYTKYKVDHPEKSLVLDRIFAKAKREELNRSSEQPDCEFDDAPISTREASGKILQQWAGVYPELLGGSADAGPSTFSDIKNTPSVGNKEDFYFGRNIHFGVREAVMGAMTNGMSLIGLKPYAATFLSFVDYMLPAVRMSALMRQPTVYILALDSIAVGGDGPTHQPVEQVSQLRLIPNLNVIRPADAFETIRAWDLAIHSKLTPTALILSRQKLPLLSGALRSKNRDLEKGFYILKDVSEGKDIDLIILASGSEVHLALDVQAEMEKSGINIRVVSCPCFELFEQQSHSYKDKVLPPLVHKRIALEMGRTDLWWRYVGLAGKVIGIDQFGKAGIMEEVLEHFGFTQGNIVKECSEFLSKN